MRTAYKFRAYPSKEQKEILNKQMYLSKELYNILLEKSKSYYKETKKTLTQYRMNVWLTQIKKERPEFDEIYSQVLQNVSKRIADAYKSFFRGCREKKNEKKVKAGLEKFNQLPKDIREAASGDIARPQLQEADVYESGTIFGVS
jgi:putative transposase